MPGPAAKDPDRRARRNVSPASVKLPASGRKGPTPKWPLAQDAGFDFDIADLKLQLRLMTDDLEQLTTAREAAGLRRRIATTRKRLLLLESLKKSTASLERQVWRDLWKTPQAVEWEKRGWARGVADYARRYAKGASGSLEHERLAKDDEKQLGLNDMAMKRLGWTTVAGAESERSSAPRSRRNARGYGDLRVVG